MDRVKRQSILERDHNTCQACGHRPAWQVHHVVPISCGGTDSLENLITLCGRCHMLISPVPAFALWRAFRIPAGQVEAEKAMIQEAIELHKSGRLRNREEG
jgi:hypothetical protein